jgi:hypothetical protein
MEIAKAVLADTDVPPGALRFYDVTVDECFSRDDLVKLVYLAHEETRDWRKRFNDLVEMNQFFADRQPDRGFYTDDDT